MNDFNFIEFTKDHIVIIGKKYDYKIQGNQIIKKIVALEKKYNYHVINFKEFSHALRLSYQAIEFIESNHITFPCLEKDILLNIKNGIYNIKQINDLLNENLEKIASVCTIHPKKELNKDWIERIILEFIL